MNEAQKTVLAVVAATLIIASIFVVPWRVASSDEIKWAPVYRAPISYARSYDTTYSRQGSSKLSYDDAEIAFPVLALEIVGIGVAGWVAFAFAAGLSRDGERSDSNDEWHRPPDQGV